MPSFRYRAVNSSGAVFEGSHLSDNLAECRLWLSQQPWTVLSVQRHWQLPRMTAGSSPISALHFADWCQQLEGMLQAGVALDEAIDDLQQDRATAIAALCDLPTQLRAGNTLANALERSVPEGFPSLWINLLRAGEQAGHLPATLRQLAEHLHWQQEQQRLIRSVLIQPMISAVSVSIAVLFLLFYLAPQLRQIMPAQNLPWITQALFWVVDGLSAHGLILLLSMAALTVAAISFYRLHPPYQHWIDQAVLQIPQLGPHQLQQQLAQYGHTLGLLYRNGIPILDAMPTARQLVSNRALHQALRDAETHIAAGLGPRLAFERTKTPLGRDFPWPAPFLRRLQQGEKTGRFAEALEQSASQLQQNARQIQERLQNLLQPAITLSSGLILAIVALALLGPLYGQLGKSF